MAEPRDYYEALGVTREADAKAIKDAFRQLALKYHPDRNKEAGASDRFKEIAEAYAVLSDPRKRAEYNDRGYAGVAGFSAEDLFAGIDFGDIFGDLGFDFGAPGVFDRLFRRRAEAARGENLEVDVVVPLERILSGGEQTVHVARPVQCDICLGSGARAGTKPRRCAKCGGAGQIVRSQRKAGVRLEQITTCLECGGQGVIIDNPCTSCGGAGQISSKESFTVRIPAGIEDGTALRIPGKGIPAAKPGLPAGDLFIVVRGQDPRFERRGRDLYRTETVGVVDAVLGADIDVPTLDGQVSVTVPGGAQPGATLRLRGKGLPRFGGGERGDLYVQLRLRIPERLSAPQRRLFQQLRDLERRKTPSHS